MPRKYPPRRTQRLVKYAGRVITIAHASKCVAKGFKGCSKAETIAVMKVIQRLYQARLRK